MRTFYSAVKPGLNKMAMAFSGVNQQQQDPVRELKSLADLEGLKARIGTEQAQQQQYLAKANEINKRRADIEDPELLAQTIAAQSGSSLPMVKELQDILQNPTETVPGGYDETEAPLPDQTIQRKFSGSPEVEAEIRRGLTAAGINRLATGDTNAAQFTQALANLQNQGIQRDVMETARGGNRELTNSLVAAYAGKPDEPYSTVGNTGATYNRATGESAGGGTLLEANIGRIAQQAAADAARAKATENIGAAKVRETDTRARVIGATGDQKIKESEASVAAKDRLAAATVAFDEARARAEDATAAARTKEADAKASAEEVKANAALKKAEQELRVASAKAGVKGGTGKPSEVAKINELLDAAGITDPAERAKVFKDKLAGAGKGSSASDKKADLKAKQTEYKAGLMRQRGIERADIAIDKVDEALASIKTGVLPKTGAVGSVLGKIPFVASSTGITDLQGTIDTIKANIGWKQIEEMREASPTGGALGQVAVQEIMFLQASIANLDRAQTREQLEANLKEVKQHFQNIKDNIAKAEAEKASGGEDSGGEDTPAPADVPQVPKITTEQFKSGDYSSIWKKKK